MPEHGVAIRRPSLRPGRTDRSSRRRTLTLRTVIRQDHDFSWGVRDRGAKVQPTHRHAHGSRSSITLACPGNPEAISEALGQRSAIRSRMESQRLGGSSHLRES